MQTTKFVISRFQENICLNDKEYILEGPEPNADIKYFDSKEQAINFLSEATGVIQSEEDWSEEGVYIEVAIV